MKSTNQNVELFFSDNLKLPDPAKPMIFLAGPSPRGEVGSNWRSEAVDLFCKYVKFPITLAIPLPSTGKFLHSYDQQVNWEIRNLELANKIMFWIPRDLETLPGFTTNVEFGMFIKSKKVVYGRPNDAPKNTYLDKVFKLYNPTSPILNSLEQTIKTTLVF